MREILKKAAQNRFLLLGLVFLLMFSSVFYRFYHIQILEGDAYRQEFLSRVTRTQTDPASRGTIYDRNGIPLAYDELTYRVTIEDNGLYSTRTERNERLNQTIRKAMEIIETHGDRSVIHFPIEVSGDGELRFTTEENRKMRFLADIYGHNSADGLSDDEKSRRPEQVMEYLKSSDRYGISGDYSQEAAVQIAAVRYAMSQNSYQRYRATILAENVSEETMVGIQENSAELPGVEIVNTTSRRYGDHPYLSQLLGYTGPVSEEELEQFESEGFSYPADAQVGKSGLEKALEQELRGTNGSRRFYVDSVGRVTEVLEESDASIGNDVWLTIDAELQRTVYHLLEQKLAGILLDNFVPEKADDGDNLVIDTRDVLTALFENHILDTEHFSAPEAQAAETRLLEAWRRKKGQLMSELESVLEQLPGNLSQEQQETARYIPEMLREQGYFTPQTDSSESQWHQSWQEGEISLGQYLRQGIQEQWMRSDIEEERYSTLEETWVQMKERIRSLLEQDEDYDHLIYQIMTEQGELPGEEICLVLLEQGVLSDENGLYERLQTGQISVYGFLREQIRTLKLTPAQLALDPSTASSVVVDPHTGEVLACVTYPGYDNNRLANRVDGAYYERLLEDRSLPLYNNATQQRTAPGSTFKPITAAAALTEGLITPETMIEDGGIFEEVTPSPRCWIYPGGSHGSITVREALRDSCNYFFYSLGFGFSLPQTELLSVNNLEAQEDLYQPDRGIDILQNYMEQFGLNENSGIEIGENAPQMADEFPVTAAIGQSNHNYTTTQLARYVSVLANHGTLYDLTLIKGIGTAEERDREPEGQELMSIQPETWNVIGEGMEQMAESNGILSQLSVSVAGKTGTAQQNRNRPNHALFIGYAPYEQPRIAVATRIAYGYSSAHAVEVTSDIFKYYFGLEPAESLLTGEADVSGSGGNRVAD